MAEVIESLDKGIDCKFNKILNVCEEIVTTLPTLGVAHAGYKCTYQNRTHEWTGTAWVRYAADTDIPSVVQTAFYAQEASDKISPVGTNTYTSLDICTIPETGLYEIEAWAYAVENTPFDTVTFGTVILTNPGIVIKGEIRYFVGLNGTGVPETVELWSQDAGVILTNWIYKDFSETHLQRIHMRGFALLNEGTTVKMGYTKTNPTGSVTVKAGSKALVRKIG